MKELLIKMKTNNKITERALLKINPLKANSLLKKFYLRTSLESLINQKSDKIKE